MKLNPSRTWIPGELHYLKQTVQIYEGQAATGDLRHGRELSLGLSHTVPFRFPAALSTPKQRMVPRRSTWPARRVTWRSSSTWPRTVEQIPASGQMMGWHLCTPPPRWATAPWSSGWCVGPTGTWSQKKTKTYLVYVFISQIQESTSTHKYSVINQMNVRAFIFYNAWLSGLGALIKASFCYFCMVNTFKLLNNVLNAIYNWYQCISISALFTTFTWQSNNTRRTLSFLI